MTVGTRLRQAFGVEQGWFTAAQSGARAVYDAEAGQPRNVGYVQLAGVSGDYISTPDAAGLDITGDIEIVKRISGDDWTPGAMQVALSKWHTTSNQRSFYLALNTDGTLALVTSADGSTELPPHTSTASVSFSNGVAGWVKVTFDVDDGAGNRVATFYTAADQNTEPSSWTQLGSTVTTAGATSIYSSTAVLMVGSFIAGTSSMFAGKVYRAIVRDGIGGTTAADFDASLCYGPGYGIWTLTIPKIYDTSGNGRAPATLGAGSNQPLCLPWKGTSSVHLESAASGTNSVSCTAPAGTASYSAAPRDGGTPSTGAAAPGAFTFTTAGDWASISLLDSGAAEVAKFDASLSTQTGHTDSYSVVWTVNRGTTGRKTVVQSPAAFSARSVILLGTDDWIDVPAAAVPALDTFAATTSVTLVYRLWHATASCMFATKASIANQNLGTAFRFNSGVEYAVVPGDGTGSDGAWVSYSDAFGKRFVTSISVGNVSPYVWGRTNSDAVAGDGVRNTIGTTSTAGAGRIGAFLDGGFAQNMEFEAYIAYDSNVETGEQGVLKTSYRGAL